MRKLFFICLIFLIGSILVTAQVPQLINYQGFLKNNEGQPLNSQVNLVFRIFNAETGGTNLWEESHNNVEVKNGIFHVLLDISGSNVFDGTGVRFLEIEVDSNVLPGRMQITSVAYSLRSQSADNVIDNSIITARIADGAVTSNKLEDNAVNTDKIQNATIVRQDIADGQVVRSINSQTDQVFIGGGSNVIVSQSGDTIKIDAQTGTGQVADGSITTIKLANDAVTSPKIQDGEVQNQDIADNSITANKINSGQVVKSINTLTGPVRDNVFIEAGSNITIGTPNDSTINISAGGGGSGDITAVNAGNYLTGGGDTGDVTLHLSTAATDTVYVNHGEVNSINTNMIVDGAVIASKIGTDEINDTHIANDAIATANIQDGAITSAKIGANQVSNADIADNTITSAKIVDGTIATADMADNIITNAKIVDGTISTNDLADDIITSAKIPSRAIQDVDINDSAVTQGKIANNAVTAAKIIDEPGIVYKQINGLFSLQANATTYAVDSISFTAPANGFIVAESNGYINVNHGTASDNICFEIKDTHDTGDALFGPGCSSFTIPTVLAAATNYRYPFCTRKVFTVTSGSTTKIFLLIRQYSGSNPSDTDVYDYIIIAAFYPTQY